MNMKFCRNAVCRVAAAWLLLSLCFANSYAQGASVFFGVRTVIFGIVTDGTTAKQMLIITNTDSVGWVHGHVGAPSKSVFAISGSDTFSIGPGQKDTTYFTFSPVDVSILRDSVWITHDAWLGLGVTNPQKIVLTGQGLSPNDSSAQLKLGGFGGTTIPWSLQVDSSALRPFAFRNVSANPARHLYGTISGIHEPFGFGIGTPNFDLPDSAWDTIQFAFSPTSVGTFRDTLVMTSNATPPNNLIKIYLSGVATARTGSMPDAAITSTFIQFLGDSVGTFTQQFTVLVNPSVEAPLHITVAHTPNPPFTVSGQQSILDTLKADTILFSFAPTKGGKFTDSLVLLTDANRSDSQPFPSQWKSRAMRSNELSASTGFAGSPRNVKRAWLMTPVAFFSSFIHSWKASSAKPSPTSVSSRCLEFIDVPMLPSPLRMP